MGDEDFTPCKMTMRELIAYRLLQLISWVLPENHHAGLQIINVAAQIAYGEDDGE